MTFFEAVTCFVILVIRKYASIYVRKHLKVNQLNIKLIKKIFYIFQNSICVIYINPVYFCKTLS